MAEIIHCPSCSRPLQLPEELIGQEVQCPSCSHEFIAKPDAAAPAAPSIASSDITSDLPPSRPPPDDFDDEYDDFDEAYDRSRRFRRRDHEPHRGGLIKGLGIASIPVILCGGLLGLILPIITIVMANSDLKAMREDRMDPDGERQTRAGRTCAIVALILGISLIFIGLAVNIALIVADGGF